MRLNIIVLILCQQCQEQITKIAEELYLVNSYVLKFTMLKQYKILELKNKEKLKLTAPMRVFKKK